LAQSVLDKTQWTGKVAGEVNAGRKSRMKTNRKGFTLVEIMIVVAIIAVLAAIAIPNFIKSRKESQKNACIANLKQIEGAIEQAKLAGKVTPGTSDIWGSTDAYIKVKPLCPYDTSKSYDIPTGDTRPVCPNIPSEHFLPTA
jgi:prepilin-type N-terminal cleavage/methylation domain-containing protein